MASEQFDPFERMRTTQQRIERIRDAIRVNSGCLDGPVGTTDIGWLCGCLEGVLGVMQDGETAYGIILDAHASPPEHTPMMVERDALARVLGG